MKKLAGTVLVAVMTLALILVAFGAVRAGAGGSGEAGTSEETPALESPAEASAVPSDVTPPEAPTGLAVENRGIGETLVLTWSANDAVDLAGYNLYRTGFPGEPPSKLTSQVITDTSYTDSGLHNGTQYAYQATAVDSSGNESAWSAEATGIPTDITPPTVPTNLGVVDPGTSDELALSWTANQERDLVGYKLYRSLSRQGPYERVAMSPPGITAYRDQWLSLGTRYYYRLSSVDMTGNESAVSEPVSNVPTAPVATSVWQHGTHGNEGGGPNQLFAPRSATRLRSGNLLVVDTFNFRVLEINPAHEIIWEYSSLIEPDDARQLANGNILITDEQGHSVLEVDYTTKAVVWRYGTGTPGSVQLDAPTAAAELPGGHIVIADAGNHRLVEVDRQKQIVWQFGTTGVSGSGLDHLNGPSSVQVLANGRLLVADTGNNQVVEIDRATKTVVWRYGGLELPRGAFRMRGGNTLISDTSNQPLIEVTQDGRPVWAYGSSYAGNLYAPRSVEELPGDGNLLVVDQHNHRVVEITH